MIYLHEYIIGRCFAEKSCMVLGPSVNLVNDIYNAPEVDVLMGVNHHTQILKPDFIVALDEHTKRLLPYYRGKLMAKHDDCDIQIGECPSFGFSGPAAMWVADYLGFKNIYLAGFDCYMHPGRTYWHDDTRYETHLKVDTTWEAQKIIWDIVKASMKHPERIKALSGPLEIIFTGEKKGK